MEVRVVILTYNNRKLIEECLPSICEAVNHSSYPCRLTVLDNGSTDTTVEYVKKNFPNVDIYISENNLFLCSFNNYLRKISEDIAILMNSDVKVDKNFIDPLIGPFEKNKEIFMTCPKSFGFNGEIEGGRTRIKFKYGWFYGNARYPGFMEEFDKEGYSASSGAVIVVDRRKFLELGGFDILYLPGRMEDVDLCFRAYRKGWYGKYIPSSVIYHKGFGSFHSRFSQLKTNIITNRNTFLFIWKNMEKQYVISNLFFLLPRIIYTLLNLRIDFLFGFLSTFPRIPAVVKRRVQTNPCWAYPVSSKEIFERVGY